MSNQMRARLVALVARLVYGASWTVINTDCSVGVEFPRWYDNTGFIQWAKGKSWVRSVSHRNPVLVEIGR